jgi:hypothetical protein
MKSGKTISLYLVDGEPSGLICAYLSNWTGQCIKVPRNLLEDAKERKEVSNIGVYFLFGVDENNPDEQKMYIGEAENVFERLIQHSKDDEKAFWDEAIIFSSKDDNLTKGHIKYLEFRLIELSNKNSQYELLNKQKNTRPKLPEMSIADMEVYLENLKIVLPTIGYDIFNEPEKVNIKKESKLNLNIANIRAVGTLTKSGFLVYKDSELSVGIKDSLSNGYKRKRDKLIEKGLILKEDNKLVFKESVEFRSPSEAAAIIVGYAINGRKHWKNSNGKTLNEMEVTILNE